MSKIYYVLYFLSTIYVPEMQPHQAAMGAPLQSRLLLISVFHVYQHGRCKLGYLF